MQRKSTRQSRGANAKESRYHKWVADQDCSCCGNCGPSIPHHVAGSSYKKDKRLIGHLFVIPVCHNCHTMIDDEKPLFKEKFGRQCDLWAITFEQYVTQGGDDTDLHSIIMGTNK